MFRTNYKCFMDFIDSSVMIRVSVASENYVNLTQKEVLDMETRKGDTVALLLELLHGKVQDFGKEFDQESDDATEELVYFISDTMERFTNELFHNILVNVFSRWNLINPDRYIGLDYVHVDFVIESGTVDYSFQTDFSSFDPSLSF